MDFRTLQSWLKAASLAILLLAASACQKKPEPPNILLISLDACRADHLSSYGYHRQTSPFLDELAARGVRFANAFVNTHGTPPSHTTILSSLYQEVHRVNHNTWEPFRPEPVPANVLMLQEILRSHGYITLGVTDGGNMGAHLGFGRGFVEFDDQGGGVESGTKKLVELIRKYGSYEYPIFAFYHTYEIHSPYAPPEQYQTTFGEFTSSFVPSSENLVAIANSSSKLSEKDLEYVIAMYDGGIRYTDHTLKKLFAQLQDLGFFDNYLVIITSDHGEEFGEHGGLLHRALMYDELLHVPLIVTGTSVPRGVVDERMVSSIDIVPTILEYVGIPRPAPVPAPMEGINLLGSARNNERELEAVFSQYGKSLYAIRTRNWKLIHNVKPDLVELYDLQNDPSEKTNVAKQFPDRVKTFRDQLLAWKEKQIANATHKPPDVSLTKEQLEKLKALGYVQ